MRSLRNLKINQSIEQGKLVYNEPWDEKLDTYANYFFSIAFIFIAATQLLNLKIHSENYVAFQIILGVSLGALGLYNFYRKLVEKKLITIESNLQANEIKRRLLDFAIKEEYEIYRQNGYCLIFNETIGFWGDRHKKTRIIFIRDYKIYFTVIQDNFRLNRPIYTTHLFLKHAFKKLLN